MLRKCKYKYYLTVGNAFMNYVCWFGIKSFHRCSSVYLQCIAGVVWCGLVFEGLAQKKCAFVVDLIPVFAVAQVQR